MTGNEAWRRLCSVACWTPLSVVGVPCAPVRDTLYRCGEDAFVLAMPYRADLVRDPDNGPFVTVVIWAVSEGAARRVCLLEREQDDDAPGAPPAAMLPPSCTPTYGCVLEAVRILGAAPVESASYRVASDGAFLYRSIAVGRWSYHFRGRDDDSGETPFVIQFRLK